MADRRMLDLCLSHAEVAPGDALPFACRGCGNYCCGDLGDPVHVLPPEVMRIHWHLQRHPEAAGRLRTAQPFLLDERNPAGLPIMMLNVRPYTWQGGNLKACPFLAVDPVNADLLLCLVHTVRPHACRLFPLGVRLGGWDGQGNAQETYRLMSYCPGFEAPGPSGPRVVGYRPPPEAQTVEDWARAQVHPEQRAEYLYAYFEVMETYFLSGWHLPLGDVRTPGRLTRAAFHRLADVFYEVPPPPDDPAGDHATVMARLRWLHDEAAEIVHRCML